MIEQEPAMTDKQQNTAARNLMEAMPMRDTPWTDVDAIVVTQADREAAASWMRKAKADGMIRRGHDNDLPTVQAFATHRTEAVAALEARVRELGELVGAAYQIVGALAEYGGVFDHPSVIRALDALSDQRETEPLLPWPHEPLPDAARKALHDPH